MKQKKSLIHDYQPGMYVACVSDKEWFLGDIVEVSGANEDIMIMFMNKNMDTNSFSWPVHDVICWIPVANILCRITTLSAQICGGRLYLSLLRSINVLLPLSQNINAFLFPCLFFPAYLIYYFC